ncbi:transcription factor [Fusarium austroafricanum]|uniref:Transcription factor n=1 Tax=Fusarium austroafricanum TaxID=2364996 RepID=A0A8H4KED8_9HYPO|nr:transcription factor [Fusarium austroafricanum]
MAPSDDEIEKVLLDTTYQVYQASPDETSVNKVRKQAEEILGLEEGFLLSSEWKQKSKTLIKERAEKLMEGWVPDNKNGAGSDGEDEKSVGLKRSSPDVESPEPKPKRQKRASKPKPKPKPKSKKASKKVEEYDVESKPSESSELSELSEFSEEEKPQKKRKRAVPKKAAPKRKSKTIESDNEDGSDAINSDTEAPVQEADEAENDKPTSDKATTPTKPQDSDEEGNASKQDEGNPAVDEEEEYSDVIDEPVKPKRKKEKKETGNKPAKAPKAAHKKVTTSDDPNTEEIKRLQGQLTKCGVRKLWHNELKKYGDDAKAKIRHLKRMLTDIGMDGRFSEAKAREIKERRELLAEVESAQEMSALWGVEGRGRASRSKSKSAKIVESGGSDAEENDGDENDDDDEDTYAARRKRVRADLAFLGDEDSDSE